MKKNIIVTTLIQVLCLLLTVQISFAQVIQTNAKPTATINMERLNRIDELVNSYINKNWLTGAVTIVIKDNLLIQYKGYGLADVAIIRAAHDHCLVATNDGRLHGAISNSGADSILFSEFAHLRESIL